MNKPLGDAVLNSGGGGVIFLKMPPPTDKDNITTNDDNHGAYVIQLSHYSGACPKESCKVQLSFTKCI